MLLLWWRNFFAFGYHLFVKAVQKRCLCSWVVMLQLNVNFEMPKYREPFQVMQSIEVARILLISTGERS